MEIAMSDFIFLINTNASILNSDEEDAGMREDEGWQESLVISNENHTKTDLISVCFEIMTNAFPAFGFTVTSTKDLIRFESKGTTYMVIVQL